MHRAKRRAGGAWRKGGQKGDRKSAASEFALRSVHTGSLHDAFPRCHVFPAGDHGHGVRFPRDRCLQTVVCSPITWQPEKQGRKYPTIYPSTFFYLSTCLCVDARYACLFFSYLFISLPLRTPLLSLSSFLLSLCVYLTVCLCVYVQFSFRVMHLSLSASLRLPERVSLLPLPFFHLCHYVTFPWNLDYVDVHASKVNLPSRKYIGGANRLHQEFFIIVRTFRVCDEEFDLRYWRPYANVFHMLADVMVVSNWAGRIVPFAFSLFYPLHSRFCYHERVPYARWHSVSPFFYMRILKV